jgi:hypothetical protein
VTKYQFFFDLTNLFFWTFGVTFCIPHPFLCILLVAYTVAW